MKEEEREGSEEKKKSGERKERERRMEFHYPDFSLNFQKKILGCRAFGEKAKSVPRPQQRECPSRHSPSREHVDLTCRSTAHSLACLENVCANKCVETTSTSNNNDSNNDNSNRRESAY